jgi:hypothetical protein
MHPRSRDRGGGGIGLSVFTSNLIRQFVTEGHVNDLPTEFKASFGEQVLSAYECANNGEPIGAAWPSSGDQCTCRLRSAEPGNGRSLSEFSG